MGIINRTLDASEQKQILGAQAVQTVTNSLEVALGAIPRAMTIVDAQTTCTGISGAPTGIIRVTRFGGASFFVGSTFLIPAVGVSGVLGVSLPAAGSTVLNLQKDDVVSIVFGGGTGAAAVSAIVDVVVQNTQDIKTWY
jgi:hypothetical protein